MLYWGPEASYRQHHKLGPSLDKKRDKGLNEECNFCKYTLLHYYYYFCMKYCYIISHVRYYCNASKDSCTLRVSKEKERELIYQSVYTHHDVYVNDLLKEFMLLCNYWCLFCCFDMFKGANSYMQDVGIERLNCLIQGKKVESSHYFV